MVFKQTCIHIIDNSGFIKSKIFHVYGLKKSLCLNKPGFVYGSIREVYKKLQKSIGKKKRIFITTTVKNKKRNDGTFINFFKNSGLPIKKRTSVVGSLVKGPFINTIKRRKLRSSFNQII